MLDALAALSRLKEGNERFVAGVRSVETLLSHANRAELTNGQAPFAIILGCSDSRVPAEIVFDQGLGDLFVIRVAGNIVAPSQVGSVEFAAEQFKTRLVVVMGHSSCGAVCATLDEMQRPRGEQSENIRAIVTRIRPALEPLLQRGGQHEREQLVDLAVRANVRASVQHLRSQSHLLTRLMEHEGLMVIGAEYDLKTGCVEFFEE